MLARERSAPARKASSAAERDSWEEVRVVMAENVSGSPDATPRRSLARRATSLWSLAGNGPFSAVSQRDYAHRQCRLSECVGTGCAAVYFAGTRKLERCANIGRRWIRSRS